MVKRMTQKTFGMSVEDYFTILSARPCFGNFVLFLKGSSDIKPRRRKPFSRPVTDGDHALTAGLIPLTDRRSNNGVMCLPQKVSKKPFLFFFKNLQDSNLMVRIFRRFFSSAGSDIPRISGN